MPLIITPTTICPLFNTPKIYIWVKVMNSELSFEFFL